MIETVTFWRIRHIPTGLYFKPSVYRSKTNLSERGKVYTRKPGIGILGKVYHHPVSRYKYETRAVVLSEWEVVEYQTGG